MQTFELGKIMNNNEKIAIETLIEFKNNHFIRDKLERDKRCGGLKMGDIYKITELNPAIEIILNSIKKKDKIIDLMAEDIFDYEYMTYVDSEQFKKCKQKIIKEFEKKVEGRK